VHLSRLLGANKRFIEQHLPHIGELICADVRDVVAKSDVLIVSLADPKVFDVLRDSVRPEQLVLDLVRIPSASSWPCNVAGLCW